ncbi:MAG: hypothetical protein Q9196_004442 [Gyalolechia fulgens]
MLALILTRYSSISIACWIVVFSPQIIENFRRHSADGLSLIFIIVWLLGDVFNILGAVLQGVLPTMTILAVYYTLADIVLLAQCFYYRGLTLSDAQPTSDEEAITDEATEDSPLLSQAGDTSTARASRPTAADADRPRRSSSFSSFHSHLAQVDATHLSPATPLIVSSKPPAMSSKKPTSAFRTFFFNTTALVLVCAAGVLGWFLSTRSAQNHYSHHGPSTSSMGRSAAVRFDLWGQIFGYLCAALYLGSRIPQLLLNYRRKSTEGVSMLFFLFACVGNLTYVMSIFAYEPVCAKLEQEYAASQCDDGEWGREYSRYILVNTSWLIGSAGTLLLDLMIFLQFWIYRNNSK